MSSCPNCGARITCGCQKRVAKDGKQVCSTCISKYEGNNKSQPQQTKHTLFRPK